MNTIYCDRARTISETVVLYDADSDGTTLNSSDVVRYKIYRRDAATPALDIDSVGALAGGSIVTIVSRASAAQVTIKVCSADVTLDPGTYQAQLLLVDSGDSNLAKVIDDGLFCVFGSPAGDVGLT